MIVRIALLLTFLIVADAACAETVRSGEGSERHAEDRGVMKDTLHGVETLVYDTGYVLTSPFRMEQRHLIRLGGVLAATGLVFAFDEEIHSAVKRSESNFPLEHMIGVGEFLDPLAYGRMNVYYFGGVGISYLAGWDVGVSMFGQILTSFAIYGILKRPVENVVGRRRPFEGEGAYSFGNADATSFFSGHTTNIFQLATIVSHHVGRTWFSLGAYAAATCVGLQRVSSDSHWPSDVVLSAAFAIAVSRQVIAQHENRRLAVEPRLPDGGQGVGLSWRF